mmetsp:Transcript_47099/g.121720  ORF Transcript_47099/g.121720 Transcript_47099/m.121720 type:complete len:814 (-) Transcript_47099:366-2807(-)|eukprot:CAMPEP_0113881318 /NCGR_PEP_ID=MMETSP0780_2-20120614/8306_1 /TAXON_ID=652834 /ORGANISM="Palpitomonas bilix" /LENGTH=813 /DNA_ID=CAMNT_0000868155 /DNA_START=1574 /DNA_END=4015 /DNA_ORIENTATION=+ /assembly_acc=CAM_ASM_000599
MPTITFEPHQCSFVPNITPSFLEENAYGVSTSLLRAHVQKANCFLNQCIQKQLLEAIQAEQSGFPEQSREERARLRTQRYHIDGVRWDILVPRAVPKSGWRQVYETFVDAQEPQSASRFPSVEVYLGTALHLLRLGEVELLRQFLSLFKHNEDFKYTLMVSSLLLEKWEAFYVVSNLYNGKEQRKQLCRKSYLDAVRARPDSGLWERMERAAFDATTGSEQLFAFHSLVVPLPIRMAWGDVDKVRECLTGRLCGYSEPRIEQIQMLLPHAQWHPLVKEIISGKNLSKYFSDILGHLSVLLCDHDWDLSLHVLRAVQRKKATSLSSHMEQIASDVHQRLLLQSATPALLQLVQRLVQCAPCAPSLCTHPWKRVMASMDETLPLAAETKRLYLAHVSVDLPSPDGLVFRWIGQIEKGASPWATEEERAHLVHNELVLETFSYAFQELDQSCAEKVVSQLVSALITHLHCTRRNGSRADLDETMGRYVDLCVSLVNEHCSAIAAHREFASWVCYLFLFLVDGIPWQITIFETDGSRYDSFRRLLQTYPGQDANRFWVTKRGLTPHGGKLVGLSIFMAVFVGNQPLAHMIASKARMAIGTEKTSRNEEAVKACLHQLGYCPAKQQLVAEDMERVRGNCIEPAWSSAAVSLFRREEPINRHYTRLETLLREAGVMVMFAMGRELHRVLSPWLSPCGKPMPDDESKDVIRKRKRHHDDQCPITLDPFQVGDEVVVCKGCSMGFSLKAFVECAASCVNKPIREFTESMLMQTKTLCYCKNETSTLSRFRVYKLPKLAASKAEDGVSSQEGSGPSKRMRTS